MEMVLSKFPVAQTVKNPPEMQETWVRSLGREDPLEEDVATHSSILAWKIPWTEESGGLPSIGSLKSWTRLDDSTTYMQKAMCSRPSLMSVASVL